MDNSHDETNTGIYEAESELPFETTQRGRRAVTVVTHYCAVHACDQKLCIDAVAVEVTRDTNESNRCRSEKYS
jgi:hypothetical protein